MALGTATNSCGGALPDCACDCLEALAGSFGEYLAPCDGGTRTRQVQVPRAPTGGGRHDFAQACVLGRLSSGVRAKEAGVPTAAEVLFFCGL